MEVLSMVGAEGLKMMDSWCKLCNNTWKNAKKFVKLCKLCMEKILKELFWTYFLEVPVIFKQYQSMSGCGTVIFILIQ